MFKLRTYLQVSPNHFPQEMMQEIWKKIAT